MIRDVKYSLYIACWYPWHHPTCKKPKQTNIHNDLLRLLQPVSDISYSNSGTPALNRQAIRAKIDIRHGPSSMAPNYQSWSSYCCCPMSRDRNRAPDKVPSKGANTLSLPKTEGWHRTFSAKPGTIPDKPSIKEVKKPIGKSWPHCTHFDPGKDCNLSWLELPQILGTSFPFLPTKPQQSCKMFTLIGHQWI